jgi:hypothetical protein
MLVSDITRPIDPARLLLDHARYLERLTNPRHRLLLRWIMYHYVIESLGKVDEMMATIAPGAIYRFHSSQRAPDCFRFAQLRQIYERIRETTGAGLVESWADDIAVDDNVVAVRGGARQLISGSSPEIPAWLRHQVDDPNAYYLSTVDVAWFFRFDSADPPLILRVEAYTDERGMSVTKVPDKRVLTRGTISEETFALALRDAGFSDQFSQEPAAQGFT